MADELSTTERLLALLLVNSMGDAKQQDKSVMLSRAGLPHSAIADLLGTTSNVVKQQVYMGKAGKKKRR